MPTRLLVLTAALALSGCHGLIDGATGATLQHSE